MIFHDTVCLETELTNMFINCVWIAGCAKQVTQNAKGATSTVGG